MAELKEELYTGGNNAWLNFVKSFREKKSVKSGKKVPQAGNLKEAGRLWQAMSEAEKSKYATWQ
jgi:HMG-box domain